MFVLNCEKMQWKGFFWFEGFFFFFLRSFFFLILVFFRTLANYALVISGYGRKKIFNWRKLFG